MDWLRADVRVSCHNHYDQFDVFKTWSSGLVMAMSARKTRIGLLILNVCLLLVLAFVTFENVTIAQTSRSHRYIAIPSTVNGLSTGVVYIMDTSQQELVAITWDHNANRLVPLGYRPIAADAQSAVKN